MDEMVKSILLLSIKPKYANLIRNGTKTVELRKRMPKKDCKIALVYESHPIKKASFLIKIKRIESRPKKVIWEKYSKKCAISKKYFNQYYKDSKESIAIIIDDIIPLEKHLTRKRLEKMGLIPPQDYRYIKQEMMAKLR